MLYNIVLSFVTHEHGSATVYICPLLWMYVSYISEFTPKCHPYIHVCTHMCIYVGQRPEL